MQLGDIELFRHATTYLTTRLLFLRGRLDADGVAVRLEDLLKEVADFPEARALLEAARSGELTEFGTARKLRVEKEARRSEAASSSRRDSEPHHASLARAAVVHEEDGGQTTDEPDIEATLEDDLDLSPAPEGEFSPAALSPTIPRAPGVPNVAPWAGERNDDESAVDGEQPAWVIPSLGPRANRSDPSPAPAASESTVPPFEELGPKLTDAGLSPALHVSSIPPPPSVPPAPHEAFSPPEEFALGASAEARDLGMAPLSPPDPTVGSIEPQAGSSLSDGSQRPGPLPMVEGVVIPRAPSVPDLIPRGNNLEPSTPLSEATDGPEESADLPKGSLSPSGEYPAIDFTTYDPLKRKSQLPARAGRYSNTPAAPEVSAKDPSPHRGSPSHPRGARGGVGVARPPAQAPPIQNTPIREIRSVPPPPEAGISLFQLASWLDERHADRVLEAVPAHATDPETRLMRCRALMQLGREEAATSELEALGAFPLLEPEVRASVARLLLDLGQTDQALHQADQAYRDDPGSDPARLALAWAAIRVDRRHNEPIWVKRAHTALAALSTDQNPYPALTLALRSCVMASTGEADKAISIAQRALGLDPDSVDAVAAIALAAARLGRGRDAQQAWCRLLDLDHREADALSETLNALGVALDVAGLQGSTQSELRWDDIEQRVSRGDAHGAREVELHAKRQLERLITGQRLDLQVLGTLSASYLTTGPVFRDFAPYDFSLWSIGRLDAALLALYGHEPRPPLDSDVWPVVLRAGTYLGETLRQAFRGRWNGTLHDARDSRVISRGETWAPLHLIQQRIQEGSGHSLMLTLRASLGETARSEWVHRLPSAVLPPTPWSASWPTASEAAAVSEGLKNSPISTFCERRGKGRLDGTLQDFSRLDTYLRVLAPPGDDVGDDWSRRACGLLGCHVGEILRAEYDGRWIDEPTTGPSRLQLELADGAKLEPLSVVQSRLVSDRKFSLEEWCQTIALRHA